MKRLAVILTLFVLATVGCVPDESLLPKGSKRVIKISDVVNPILEMQKEITFASWDGEWKGMDCGTEITLKPDGVVEMTEYGYAVETYKGKYKIWTSDDGKHSAVLFKFDDSDAYMEPLAVYKSNDDLLFIPALGSNTFAMGNRSGATIPSGDSFWPFRHRKPITKK